MQIELSDQEILILDRALEAWTNEPMLSGTLSSVVKTVLNKRAGRPEQSEAEFEQDVKRASAEMSNRRMQAAIMRAKLAMVLRPNS